MSNLSIADKILVKIQTIINNELPLPDCPQKKLRVKWDREQVKRIIVERILGTISNNGPTEYK